MMADRQKNSLRGTGMERKTVTVEEVLLEQNRTICSDDLGAQIHVPLAPRRPERIPRQGEKWIVDREFSHWSFVTPLGGLLPAITGDVSTSDPVLILLIQTLADLGYIRDETTSGAT